MLQGLGTAVVVIACVVIPVAVFAGLGYLVANAAGKRQDSKKAQQRQQVEFREALRNLTPEQRADAMRQAMNAPPSRQIYPTSDGRRFPGDHSDAERAFGSGAPPFNH